MTVPVPAGAGGVDRAGEAEAVEAVGVALGADQCCDPSIPATMHRCHEWKAAQLAVRAAYPVIAAAVRAEVAREILTEAEREEGQGFGSGRYWEGVTAGKYRAAFIASPRFAAAARVAREVPE